MSDNNVKLDIHLEFDISAPGSLRIWEGIARMLETIAGPGRALELVREMETKHRAAAENDPERSHAIRIRGNGKGGAEVRIR